MPTDPTEGVERFQRRLGHQWGERKGHQGGGVVFDYSLSKVRFGL